MTIMDTPFVPTDEIRRITTGSYEHLIARIEKVVNEDPSRFFGVKVPASVIGTFTGYALVLAENGDCIRIRYEDNTKTGIGLQVFSGGERVPIQTYKLPVDYLKAEARKAVDCYLRGSQVESAERFRTVLRLVEAKQMSSDEQLAEGVFALLKSERPWKQQLVKNTDKFKNFLGEETIATIETVRLKPRFTSLYESTEVFVAGIDTYREVVVEALQTLAARIDTLREEVEKAYVQLPSLAEALAEVGESEVLTSLDAFAQDLLNDLRSVHRVVVECSAQLGRIDCLGRIHDSVTEELNQYEVAARFVIEMTLSLVEAIKK